MKYRKKKPNGPTFYHVGAHRDIASDQRRRRAHSIQRILCLVAVALFVLPLFVLGVTSWWIRIKPYLKRKTVT